MGGPFEIGVVGAGIAGLASAITLSRLGHRVTVHERFEVPRPVGAGLMIQPTGLAALERLSLRRQIEFYGQRIDRLHGITDRGATIFDLAYADLHPGLNALAVHRSALHRVLWRGFESCGAKLETGRAIAAVETVSGGRSRLRDQSGRLQASFDLVIDASGARSPLRAWVCEREPRQFAYGAVWATVPDIGIAAGMLAQRYVAARVMIGYLPLGRAAEEGSPVAAFFWSLKPDDHARWSTGFGVWRDDVERLWPELGPALTGLTRPDDLTLAQYIHFTANRIARGNVVLIGDAAHATSPQLGQGANQGLIDAVVLADALRASPDLATAITLFGRARRRHVRFYQYASALMTPFFQSDSAMLARLRDLTFNRLKILPYAHHEMIRTLAGLKTGLLTARDPHAIVNCLAGETPPAEFAMSA